MNEEYMPAPSRNAVALVVQTPRMRIIAMSISGTELRVSTTTQTAHSTRPATSTPIVRADPHPHVVVSLTATSASEIPALINAAAPQLMRPGTRTGDSGTKRHVQKAAGTMTTSGIQNSQ